MGEAVQTETEPRFWLMLLDGEDDGRWAGWWGVVDEEEGGIIAVAGTEERATGILRAFAGGLIAVNPGPRVRS